MSNVSVALFEIVEGGIRAVALSFVGKAAIGVIGIAAESMRPAIVPTTWFNARRVLEQLGGFAGLRCLMSGMGSC